MILPSLQYNQSNQSGKDAIRYKEWHCYYKDRDLLKLVGPAGNISSPLSDHYMRRNVSSNCGAS